MTVTVEMTLSGDAALNAADDVTHGLWSLAGNLPAGTSVVNVATTISPDLATRANAVPEATPRPTDTAPLRLFPAARAASLDSAPLRLTRREYDLLLHLARHPGRVYTRRQLWQAVWQDSYVCGERTIDVHIHRIRGKLDGRGPVITTLRGVGYRLDAGHRVHIVAE